MRYSGHFDAVINDMPTLVHVHSCANESCDQLLAVIEDHPDAVILQALQRFEFFQRHPGPVLAPPLATVVLRHPANHEAYLQLFAFCATSMELRISSETSRTAPGEWVRKSVLVLSLSPMLLRVSKYWVTRTSCITSRDVVPSTAF